MNWQAYDSTWAFHAALRARAARWRRRQQLRPAQLPAIEAAYPLPFYQPVWPVRVGLFVFTWIGVALGGGFLAVLMQGRSYVATALVVLLACFGGLERLIRERRFYHAGADNALLYAGTGTACWLILNIFPEPDRWSTHYASFASDFPPLALGLVLLLAVAVRYADVLATSFAFGAVLLMEHQGLAAASGPTGFLLPSLLYMATASAAWLGARAVARRLARNALADYYASCLLAVKLLALTVFYLAGNYLVVRESYGAVHAQLPAAQLPFAPVFYAFTAGVPLLYLGWGLRRGDRPTFWLGLLTLAFSLYTLRHYRSLLRPEIAAVAGGLVLTVAAGALLRFLRPARFGLTSLPDDVPRHLNLENLIQAQTAHVPGAPVADGGFAFGGGHTGGGGATGEF